MKGRRTCIWLVLLLLALGGNLQAQTTVGTIQGTVTAPAGDPLSGVLVTITSPNLQGERTQVTDASGQFRFTALPPGTYKASYRLEGFQSLEQESIPVLPEKAVTLEAILEQTFTEEVRVTSEVPILDVTSTALSDDFSQELIEALPVGRDFTAVTYLATGAVDGGNLANDQLGGSPSIMGASALENRYVVDGIDTTDPAYGLSGTSVSASFLDDVQVKTGGYEAEYGGALGGVINMVTRSGSNTFSGDVFGFFTNDSLWSDAKIPTTRGSSKTIDQEYDVGFNLGGKFIEDKLWYFVAYNPSNTNQNVRNDVYTTGGPLYQTNVLGRDFKRDYSLGKLNWLITQNNSLVATIIGDPSTTDGDYYTSNFVDSPFVPTTDQTYDVDLGGFNASVSFTSIFSQNAFFEARAAHHENTQKYTPNLDATNYQDQTSDGRWTNGVGDSAGFGGSGFQQPKDDRTRDQLRASVELYLGEAHDLKIGGGVYDVTFDMDYNVAGPSAAFCAEIIPGVTYAAAWDSSGYVVPNCDATGPGSNDGYMMPARVGNRFRLRDSYYYNRNYKNQSEGTTTEANIYAQDAWKVASNFTLQLGLRAESSKSEGNYTNVNSGATLDFGFGDMVAPRAGFIWDPTKNGRSKVFGHYGRFYQSIPLDINVRSLGNENYDFYFYEYPESGLPSTDNAGVLTYIYFIKPGGTRIDSGLKSQYLEEYVFGGDYQLRSDVVVGIKYINRSLGRVIEDISVDRGITYFVTNPGGTYDVNPATDEPLDEPVFFPEPKRDFDGVELSLDKRLAKHWQIHSSLLWSKLEGNYEGLYSRDNQQIDPNITSKFDLPELLANADGTLQNDREWQFKTFGSYNFDMGLVAGFNFFYLTGNPISKLGADRSYGLDERFVTPRGSEGRVEDWWNLDVHLSYPIKIGNGKQLAIMLDGFNLFDEQAAVEVDQRWTVFDQSDPDPNAQTNPDWGEPLVYAPPRRFRVGVRFSF